MTSLFLFICLVGEACVSLLEKDKASSLTGATVVVLVVSSYVLFIEYRELLSGHPVLMCGKNAVPSSSVCISDGGLEEEADSILECLVECGTNVRTNESHNLSVTVLLIIRFIKITGHNEATEEKLVACEALSDTFKLTIYEPIIVISVDYILGITDNPTINK